MTDKQNGSTIPPWYNDTRTLFAAQQADVFLLYGNVLDYPCRPMENMLSFLRRMIRAEAIAEARNKYPEFDKYTDNSERQEREELLTDQRIFCSYSMTTGLSFASEDQEYKFAKLIGGEKEEKPTNRFAKAQVPTPMECFEQVDQFFRARTEDDPSLVFVVKRADLLLSETPTPPPADKMLVDLLAEWAERGISRDGNAWNRVFLLASDRLKVYEGVRQGRVAEVKVALPDLPARKQFIQATLAAMAESKTEVKLEKGLSIDDLSTITGSLTMMGIEDVLYQGSLSSSRTIGRGLAQRRKDELVRQAYGGCMDIEYPELTFEDIVGFEPLKEYMMSYVLPKLVRRDPLCPKGCLLAGPPGCTKTAIARALANAMKLPLVMVRMDLIKDKYVGESNKRMAQLTEGITALAPCIVLFDEIDKMFGGEDNTGVTEELKGALQTFVNDIPRGTVYFIGTSNYPEVIPPALLRPGRLDKVIPMLPQHIDGERDQVLMSLARRMKLKHDLTPAQWKTIGDQANMFTGADLELLISEADICRNLNAKREGKERAPTVSVGDFEEALENVVPTMQGVSRMIFQALRMTTNFRFVPASVRPAAQETQKSTDEKLLDEALEKMKDSLDL